MEFLKGTFSLGFLRINSSLLRLKFLSDFLPSFSILQNSIHEQTSFLVSRIFCRVWFPVKSTSSIKTVKSTKPKNQVFCPVDVQELHLLFFAVVVFGIALLSPQLGNIEKASACHTGRRMIKSEKPP
jgi:hypothetical protein